MTKATKPKAEPTRRQPQPEDFPILFDEVSGGRSMAAACRARGIDHPSVCRAIAADTDLETAYEAARQERGDYYGEQVVNTAAGVLGGKIKPDAGRVAIDAFKWTAARMAPKRWGDRVAHEHTGKDGGPIQTATKLDIEGMTVEQQRALASIPVPGR